MKSTLAMIHREFLEHRGAFLYAPAVLLGLFTLAFGSALAFNRVRMPFNVTAESALKFYEMAFLGMAALWLLYLMVALFFYYADAFAADRRNNSMLFWKSMPMSDFKVLATKMLAGMTILPGLIFAALITTGIVLYALTALAVIVVPRLLVPGIGDIVASSSQLGLFALLYLALALLWYAPFFAWVGALSTAFGRWSIPLAFLIPGVAILVENLVFRGLSGVIGQMLLPSGGAPSGGYVFDYLRERADFGLSDAQVHAAFLSETPLDPMALTTMLLSNIDWAQLGGGLIAAALLVYLASEYRRRVISA